MRYRLNQSENALYPQRRVIHEICPLPSQVARVIALLHRRRSIPQCRAVLPTAFQPNFPHEQGQDGRR